MALSTPGRPACAACRRLDGCRIHAGDAPRLATLFRPEDIYIANLMGALNQINNGATTLVDWCHNNPTLEHSDAASRALDP